MKTKGQGAQWRGTQQEAAYAHPRSMGHGRNITADRGKVLKSGTRLELLATLWLLAASLAVSSCSRMDNRQPVKASRPLRLAVVPQNTVETFWQQVMAGAAAAAKEAGPVTLLPIGPLPRTDAALQNQALNQLLNSQLDGLAVAAAHPTALCPTIGQFGLKAVPVVAVAADLNCARQLTFVGGTDYAEGQRAADLLAKLLPDGGHVLLLSPDDAPDLVRKRMQGCLDGVKRHQELVVGIGTVALDRHTTIVEETLSAILQGFDKEPNFTLAGMFCTHQEVTIATVKTLRRLGRSGQVKLVGFGLTPALLEAVRAGELHALFAPDAKGLGRESVRALVCHANGQKIPARITVPALIITPENANSDEVNRLFQSAPPSATQ